MCKWKGCNAPGVINDYCLPHWSLVKPHKKDVEQKEPYKIPRESKKRAKENRVDQKQNRKIRTDNIYCQMNLKGCTRFAQGVQHLKGRTGKLLTDISNKIPACNNCNRRAETHPEEARAKGVAKYKNRIN